MHAHVRALLQLRQEIAALRRGRTVNLHVADKTWAYARVLDGQAAVVGINTGDEASRRWTWTLSPSASPTARRLRDRIGSLGEAVVEGRPPPARPAARLIGGIRPVGRTIPLISLLSFMKFRDD